MSRDVFEEIKEEIGRNKILIYMKGNALFPQCGFSGGAGNQESDGGDQYLCAAIAEEI